MRYFLWTTVLVLSLVGTVRAGVLITVQNRSLDGTGPELMISKIAIDGNRVRIDHEEPNKSGHGSVIYLGDKKHLIVLDHRGNSFQIMTKDSLKAMNEQLNQQMKTVMKQMESRLAQLPPEQRKMMEQMMRHQMPQAAARTSRQKPPAADVRATGVKKKIKGYPTRQYEVYQNGNKVREMWVTGWPEVGVKRDDFRIFKDMHQFQQEAFGSMNRGAGFQSNDSGFDEFRQVDGLPVLVTSFKGTVKDRETTLKSVEKKDFADSYFKPPTGYKENRQLMGLQGGR